MQKAGVKDAANAHCVPPGGEAVLWVPKIQPREGQTRPAAEYQEREADYHLVLSGNGIGKKKTWKEIASGERGDCHFI